MFEEINERRRAVEENIRKSFGLDIEKAEETDIEKAHQVGDEKVYQGVTYFVAGFNAKGTPLWRKKKDSSGGGGAAAKPKAPAAVSKKDNKKDEPIKMGKFIVSKDQKSMIKEDERFRVVIHTPTNPKIQPYWEIRDKKTGKSYADVCIRGGASKMMQETADKCKSIINKEKSNPKDDEEEDDDFNNLIESLTAGKSIKELRELRWECDDEIERYENMLNSSDIDSYQKKKYERRLKREEKIYSALGKKIKELRNKEKSKSQTSATKFFTVTESDLKNVKKEFDDALDGVDLSEQDKDDVKQTLYDIALDALKKNYTDAENKAAKAGNRDFNRLNAERKDTIDKIISTYLLGKNK